MSKLAISNIAWTTNEEPAVAEALQKLGVHYIEIAPTKTWTNPLAISDADIETYKQFWARYDIEIIAFQSMLFGKPELTIFDELDTRNKTENYLIKYIELAGRAAVPVLVFGSPKNRQVKNLPQDEISTIARDFFGSLGEHAQQNHTNFCIEPNGEAYGCDFITTAAQGLDLVKNIGNTGFRLHLDTGCMTMSGDDLHASIVAAKDWLRHFHVSSPFLQPLEENEVDHAAAAAGLEEINYQHFVSIEMRPDEEGKNVDRVKSAVAIAKKYYKLA